MSSSNGLGAMRPGSLLVVAGAGFEAAVQDAHESVGELPQSSIVTGAAGSVPVVVSACAGRATERAERLGQQRVDEPIVVHEPGQRDLLPARGPGDRGGPGVILASLGRGIAVGIVTELGEHPGTENRTQTRLGPDDL